MSDKNSCRTSKPNWQNKFCLNKLQPRSSENPKSGFSDDLSPPQTTYFLFFNSLNALPTTNSELMLMPNAAIQGLT